MSAGKYDQLWDLETAMEILSDPEAESQTWAEAVEWLILNGPPEVQQILIEASSAATTAAFPDLQPTSYTPDGKPYYNISSLAESLGMSEEDVMSTLKKKGVVDFDFPSTDDSATTH